MSALGFVMIGFGILTAWAGFDKVNVFDILRSFIGSPVPQRDTTGAVFNTPPVKGKTA